MIKTETKIIDKMLNHITKHGKKIKSEKIVLQSVKALQKPFKKQSKKIFQLSLLLTTPIFNIFIKKKKKKKDKITSTFITKSENRISFAIKSIVNQAQKNKTQYFYQALKNSIVETNKVEGTVLNLNRETQKKVLLNKHLFKYYN